MKLLLLVHSEADVAHLDAAARAILNTAITGIWCVFSPAITVSTSEAAAKLDGEIAQLKTHEKAAAERGDYAAAAGYKTNREGKELDRAKALRDAWKTAPAEERKAKTQAIFSPFIEPLKSAGLNVRITGHSDHYDREQWVQMLNSLSGVWFKEFVPGQFVLAWPESVETSVKKDHDWAAMAESKAAINPKFENATHDVRIPAETKNAPISRREELTALHPMKLGPLMRTLGLDPEGLSRQQKIDSILAAEAQPAATPELAEY